MANLKIGVIGGGAWGTAISNVIATSISKKSLFEKQVLLWVYQETFEKTLLTDLINKTRENKKYLPDVKIHENVHAEPDVETVVSECNILVLAVPHEFIPETINRFKQTVLLNRENYHIISLAKGLLSKNNGYFERISEYVMRVLRVPCSVLMGANIAKHVGQGFLSEATIAGPTMEEARFFANIFNTNEFRVNVSDSPVSVELYGALKNIVCIAVGISKGLDLPSNTQAAVFREGVLEMMRFVGLFSPREDPFTFFESCGLADLLTSTLTGRNFQCGVDITKNKSIECIQDQMCGQKLQGVSTCRLVSEYLAKNNMGSSFPLMDVTYKIITNELPCQSILDVINRQNVKDVKDSYKS